MCSCFERCSWPVSSAEAGGGRHELVTRQRVRRDGEVRTFDALEHLAVALLHGSVQVGDGAARLAHGGDVGLALTEEGDHVLQQALALLVALIARQRRVAEHGSPRASLQAGTVTP